MTPIDAQADARLAVTYDLLREFSTMPDNYVFPRAIAGARKAVALDDSLSEAHRRWPLPRCNAVGIP